MQTLHFKWGIGRESTSSLEGVCVCVPVRTGRDGGFIWTQGKAQRNSSEFISKLWRMHLHYSLYPKWVIWALPDFIFFSCYLLTNLSAHSARIWSLKGKLGKWHCWELRMVVTVLADLGQGFPPAANQEWEIKVTATTTVNISIDTVLGLYLCYVTEEPYYFYVTNLERLSNLLKVIETSALSFHTSFNHN